jgi:hypothetical protein
MSFDALGLSPELLHAVADEGYTEPTPVQREAIPLVLARRDLLAGAQTGTGKTAAFVLPIIQILHETRASLAKPVTAHVPAQLARTSRATPATARPPIRVLVVVPTRELAIQVEESVRTYGKRNPVTSTTIFGGVGFEPQAAKLRGGPEVVVATPGRLLDHASQRTIDLSRVEILVLDEADRLLDMGFIRDVRKIIELLPGRRQNLLFSATFPDGVRDLATSLLHNPARVQATPRNTTTELTEQGSLCRQVAPGALSLPAHFTPAVKKVVAVKKPVPVGGTERPAGHSALAPRRRHRSCRRPEPRATPDSPTGATRRSGPGRQPRAFLRSVALVARRSSIAARGPAVAPVAQQGRGFFAKLGRVHTIGRRGPSGAQNPRVGTPGRPFVRSRGALRWPSSSIGTARGCWRDRTARHHR